MRRRPVNINLEALLLEKKEDYANCSSGREERDRKEEG